MKILPVLAAALALTPALSASQAYAAVSVETRTAAACPKSPKIGQVVSLKGRIASLDKSYGRGVIFLKGCRIVIFAEGNLRDCRKGGTLAARGRVQLYDLYPGMEAHFINPKKVACSA